MALKETISDALWMSVLAGLGGVFIEVILLGCFYLFDPVMKMILENHGPTIVISFLLIFAPGHQRGEATIAGARFDTRGSEHPSRRRCPPIESGKN